MATPAPLPDLVDLIEAAATANVARVAIRAVDGERTFAQVLDEAAAVAAALRAGGVGPGHFVGLWAERRTHLLGGIVGILAAGAAYVPLDPTYPSERIRYIVDDASPTLIVAAGGREGRVPDFGLPVVGVAPAPPAERASLRPAGTGAERLRPAGGDKREPPAGGDERLRPAGGDKREPPAGGDERWRPAGGRDAAYLIYTSGSTGRPKGVVVEHASLVNFLLGMAADMAMRPGHTVVGTAPIAFDASIPNLLLPLLSGATLRLPSTEESADPHAIAGLLEAVDADYLKCSNSVLRMLCEIRWPGRPGLKVVTGGEALSAAVVTTLLPLVGELWNYYGPTETTVSSMRARLRAGDTDPVPIGTAMPGVDYRVLGPDLTPVAPGEVGELWITGAGVARGYLNLPDQTAERFVTLPVAGTTARGFRTGDMVRQRPDGALVTLGRTDDQVKVRGFRVELPEIEVRLAEHADVLQAVVVLNRNRRGDDRLVAYVRSRSGALDVAGLRAFVARLLPEYMVPAMIFEVGDFPVTPAGKVDRQALTRRDVSLPAGHVGAPIDDPVEHRIAVLFASVLDVSPEQLQPTDDFFALGGQSIRAVELMGLVNRDLQVRLPLSALMSTRTIRTLAAAVTRYRSGRARSPLVKLRDGVGTPLFCVHDGSGNLIGFHELVTTLPATRPVYGLEMIGADRAVPTPHHLDEIVERYVTEVRAACPDGPYVFAGYSFGGFIAFLMAARLAELGVLTDLVALLDTNPPRQLLRAARAAGPGATAPRSVSHDGDGSDPPGADRPGRLTHLRLRARDAGDLIRDRTWRAVVMPLWVERDRVVPRRLHYPERVLIAALAAAGDFPTYDGRVVHWWGRHHDNVPTERMVAAWERVATGGLEVHTIAGPDVRHVDFLKGRCGRWVADGLEAEMAAVDARHGLLATRSG